MTVRPIVLLALAGIALLPVGCGPSETVTIQGAGATFPAPLYKRWFLEYYRAHPNVRVNYQAIGSGAGVSQLQEGLNDFAASDEALKKKRLDEIAEVLAQRDGHPVELLQIPMTAGSVALCYNVPGNPELELPRKVYVGIALGEITFWDDDAIKKANPKVDLPHKEITFIRRAESSGTTFVFTSHLSAIDERWKNGKGLGPNKSPQWPVGIGGKGNSGVAALIKQTPGAFGYLETGYAELIMQEPDASLRIAKLENHKGNFSYPTDEHSRLALEEADFEKAEELGATVADPKGKDAYPIVTFTWIICRKNYVGKKKTIGDNLKAVLTYCLESDEAGQGQTLSKELGYAPLPKRDKASDKPKALDLARAKVKEINADEDK